MSIYMRIPSIKGSVTAKHYENWIPINSAEFGLKLPVSNQVGYVNQRVSGNPKASDILRAC